MNINPQSSQTVSNDLYAAIDLGSNSFHLVISRYEHNEFVVVDRLKSTVRLAAGLDEFGKLTQEAEQRALTTLEQFSQLLRKVPPQNVRAVGTNAMRRMHDSSQFIDKAEKQLGTSIEIIAGREEARLIYLGVVKGAEFGDAKRIVIDIGGGSTEVIVGKSDAPRHRESLEVGCVVLSQAYFADGVLTEDRFRSAILFAELALQPYAELFKNEGWEYAIGCSGTVKALSNILDSLGLAQGEITKSALDKLYELTIQKGLSSELEFVGLNDDRRPVFAGGLSILLALFEVLNIERMHVSNCALRDGVLYDLLGRSSNNDVRETAINALLKRCGVDLDHANRVKQTANILFDGIASTWDIDSDLYRKMLSWAALSHEVGMLISHDGYQKHGSYLVNNADMVGFARRDQALFASLIRVHRGKFSEKYFDKLPASLITPAKRLAAILRIAVLLHRTRGSIVLTDLGIAAKSMAIELEFPETWLENHPLTQADLEQEKLRFKAVGLNLRFKSNS